MGFKLSAGLLITFLFETVLFGQAESYNVNKVTFSTDNFDEFSPVFYKDKLVFSTNRNPGLSFYSNLQDERFLNIYYVHQQKYLI